MYDKLALITETILIDNGILSIRIFHEEDSPETSSINKLLGDGIEKCKDDKLEPLLSVLKNTSFFS